MSGRPVAGEERHAPFADLFPEADAHRRGAYPTLGPYTGLVRAEPGAAFAVGPTAYRTPPGGGHRDGVGYVTREPSRQLFALAGGVVRGADGAVFDPGTGLGVRETLETWDEPVDRHPALRPGAFGPAERVPGVSLLLATLGGGGFYHFLLEALPKLALARDLLPACAAVLVPGAGEPWRAAWLARAGVDLGRVRWLSPGSHLACEQILFTGRLVRHFEPNPWAVATLRALVPPPPRHDPGGRLVWLDRTGAANRRQGWEAELRRLATPDADPVDFAGLTPGAVARVSAGARAFAGLHGAAFANILFAPPGARVLEFQVGPVAPWFARLAGVCGHRHLAVPVSAGSIADAAAAGRMFLADG